MGPAGGRVGEKREGWQEGWTGGGRVTGARLSTNGGYGMAEGREGEKEGAGEPYNDGLQVLFPAQRREQRG